MDTVQIIELPAERWQEYKSLRLAALKTAPTSFASSYQDTLKKSDQFWQTRLKDSQSQKNSLLLFAQSQGQLIGMVGALFNQDQKRKHASSIVALYVSPEFRGQNVGSKLMAAILDKLDQKPGIIKVDLDVNTQNSSAIKLYQKFGFQIVGTYQKDLFVDGVYYDLYEMEKLFQNKL